jgi:transcriptional regulator GlxA family with amidase domain
VLARESGFGSPDNLRKHFGRALRTTPQAYRRAFRTMVNAPAR